MGLYVGPGALNFNEYGAYSYTRIELDDPSNGGGKLDYFEVAPYDSLTGLKVGTFSRDGAKFTMRDFATIGNVAGPGGTWRFTGLDITVATGDYLGAYFSAGNIERNSTGYSGYYYLQLDGFDDTERTYTLQTSKVCGHMARGHRPGVKVDAGDAAISSDTNYFSGYTRINKGNYCHDHGKITSAEIFAFSNLSGVIVGTAEGDIFAAGNASFKTRDWEEIGSVTAGSLQTFTGLDIEIENQDLAAIYWSGGTLYARTWTGTGHWYKSGNQFDGSTQAHTYLTGKRLSFLLFGYTTIEESTANIDAVVKKTHTKTTELNALLKTGFSKVLNLDAYLGSLKTKVSNLDAELLKILTFTKEADLDSMLQKARNEKETDLDSKIQNIGNEKEADLDSMIQKAGTEKETELDGLLRAIKDVGTELDGALQSTMSTSVLLDAVFQTSSSLSTFSDLDAMIAKTFFAKKESFFGEITPDAAVSKGWYAVGADEKGEKLLAGEIDGRLYISSNSGSSWTETRPAGDSDKAWKTGFVSSDGEVMIAAEHRLWKSTSYDSWEELRPAGDAIKDWYALGMSADGTKMIAGVANGRLYISSNSGASWTETRPDGDKNVNWVRADINDDGTKMIVSNGGGARLFFSDSYDSWTEIENLPWGEGANQIVDISLDTTGNKIVVFCFDDPDPAIFYSSDGGDSWEKDQNFEDSLIISLEGEGSWMFFGNASKNGEKIIACCTDGDALNYVLVSRNRGESWEKIWEESEDWIPSYTGKALDEGHFFWGQYGYDVLLLLDYDHMVLDAYLEKSYSSESDLDSHIAKKETIGALIDSVLKELKTATSELGGLIQESYFENLDLDGKIQSGKTKETELDGKLQAGKTKEANLDSRFQGSNVSEADLDGKLQAGKTKEADLDSMIQKAGTEKETELDGVLAEVKTLSSNLDSVVQKLFYVSTELDAKLLGGSKSRADLDSMIQEIKQENSSLMALVAKIKIRFSSLDAAILEVKTKDTDLDAELSGAKKIQLQINGLIQGTKDVETTINASVSKMKEISGALGAAISKISLITVGIEVIIKKKKDVYCSLDSKIEKEILRMIILDALISERGKAKELGLDALISEIGLSLSEADAIIKKEFGETVELDGKIQAEKIKAASLLALIISGGTRLIFLDSILVINRWAISALDAVIAKTEEKTINIDATVWPEGYVISPARKVKLKFRNRKITGGK